MTRLASVTSIAAVTAAVLLSSCGSDDEDEGEVGNTEAGAKTGDVLRVEATEGPRGTELIVYVLDEDANARATAGGRKTVDLRCLDKGGKLLVRKAHAWPFLDTDNGLTDPHVHQPLGRAKAVRVSRCELGGTRGPLSGELTATGFE